jgi:hypothetical protein
VPLFFNWVWLHMLIASIWHHKYFFSHVSTVTP